MKLREIAGMINSIIQGNALEILKTFPNESIDCCVTSPPYWCYSEGTEILSYEGWKEISKVKIGEKVLSVNPNTLKLDWAKIVDFKDWDYKGEMIHFENTHIDLIVTPNHKMFVYSKRLLNPIKARVNHKKVGFFIEAKNVKQGYVTPKTGFIWKGENPKFFTLLGLKTIYNKQNRHFSPMEIEIEKWLAFFGLWIAEGYVRGSKGGKKKTYSVVIKQKKPKDVPVRKLLKSLPFEFKEYQAKNQLVCFEITDKQLWDYLSRFGNSFNKFVPREIKELSPRLLNIFLKWYLFGDGCIKQSRQVCYSVSSRLRDDLTEIALKIGKNTSQNGNNIAFLKRKTVKIYETQKQIEYEGKVYGVEVDINHTLCVRRNNKVVFSGNSLRDYGVEPIIWDGDENCEHEWKTDFCSKCSAWRGSLGLEPTFELYLQHLWAIFDEVKRVLKKTGTCWVNLSDTYFNGNVANVQCVKPCGTSDKALEDYQDYDYFYKNLCDGCRRAYWIGRFHKESLLASKQVASLFLSSLEHKEFENYPYSNSDSSQRENHNEVANQGQKQTLVHECEPIPSSRLSKQNESSSELLKNVSNQNHEAKCLLCGRSLTSYVQESAYKMVYINDIEKRLATLNPNRLDNVSLDLAYPYYTKKFRPIQAKSLCAIPDRFKIEMINRGWICRSELIWHKPNCMPSSVRDRFTVDFEKIFFFTKAKKYYFEQQFEDYKYPMNRWGGIYTDGTISNSKYLDKNLDASQLSQRPRSLRPNPQGRNKRCVWMIATKPYLGAHFAVFPEALIETPIKAGCPEGGIVLDPFMGAGTTALVAHKLNRHYIGIELKPEYAQLTERRFENKK